MSKLSSKRKITVDLNVKPLTDQPKARPSVFERLGTKASTQLENFCRHWAQNGTCPYNKNCKYANTHQLISPSKQRLIKKDATKDDPNKRLHSTIVKANRNSELEFENWDQTALEYADADALEKRRQELQRELELQLKMESKQVHKKDKKPKKRESSTSSTGSSSSTTDSSSSSDDTTTVSSSTSKESHRRKLKKPKGKHSSSSSDDIALKKKLSAKNAASKRAATHSKLQAAVRIPNKKPTSPTRKVPKTPPSKISPTRPLSSTPPLKIKSSTPLKTAKKILRKSVERKRGTPSPRPRDREDKHKKEREREKEKLKERHERTLTPKKDSRLKETRKRESPTRVRRRDDRSIDRRDDRRNKDRSLERPRKDGRHDDRDPKRMSREEREAAREKEREEALARCQERQRERERLKKIAEKERELQLRNRERERGIDKSSDRLLPLRMSELDRGSSKTSRDKSLDRGSDRSYNRARRSDRYDQIDRPYRERGFERDPDRTERDYPTDRRLHPEDKTYGSPYENRRVRDDRHYIDPEGDRYEDHREYPERRETWDEPGRYVRDSSRPIHKNREDYNRHDWADRPEWEREEWEQTERTEEEWRGYERPTEWQGEDRRRNWQGSEWGSVKRPPFTARPTKPSPLVREEKVTTPKEGTSVASPTVKAEVKTEVEAEAKPDITDSPGKKLDVDTLATKRLAESPADGAPEPKKPCTPAPAEPIAPLEPDDLSEISDDADEILNREDDLQEPSTVASMDQDAPTDPSDPVPDKPEGELTALSIDTETKPPSPKPIGNGTSSTGESPKPGELDQSAADDEALDQMGFEEISDEELEEETKAKGLGDALGVDWASLVAESRPRIKNNSLGSAKKRWEPHRVLARIGVSIEMAGAKVVNEIFDQVKKQDEEVKLEDIKVEGETVHPIAGMQVSLRDWKTKRRTLFANAGPQKRALCARRDLEIRRYLCKLPTKDTIGLGDAQHPHDPEIFRMALKLYERTL